MHVLTPDVDDGDVGVGGGDGGGLVVDLEDASKAVRADAGKFVATSAATDDRAFVDHRIQQLP